MYVKPEAAITVFELLMMGSVLPKTCWAIKKHWSNKFYYMVASYWFFLWYLICLNFVHIKNSNRRTAHTATAQCWLFYMSADICTFTNFNLLHEDCVKENQLDAQLILSIFCQPLHVSGVSRPIIRRYNRMYTTIGMSKKNNKYQLLYTYGCTSWWWA